MEPFSAEGGLIGVPMGTISRKDIFRSVQHLCRASEYAGHKQTVGDQQIFKLSHTCAAYVHSETRPAQQNKKRVSRSQVRGDSVFLYLEQGFHHPTGDQGLPPSVVTSQVVEEGEQRRGKLVRVRLHQRV